MKTYIVTDGTPDKYRITAIFTDEKEAIDYLQKGWAIHPDTEIVVTQALRGSLIFYHRCIE